MQRKGKITTEYCGIPGYGYNARNYPSSFPIEVGFPEVIRGVMGKANELFFFLPACQCCDYHKSNEKWMPVVLKECA